MMPSTLVVQQDSKVLEEGPTSSSKDAWDHHGMTV